MLLLHTIWSPHAHHWGACITTGIVNSIDTVVVHVGTTSGSQSIWLSTTPFVVETSGPILVVPNTRLAWSVTGTVIVVTKPDYVVCHVRYKTTITLSNFFLLCNFCARAS